MLQNISSFHYTKEWNGVDGCVGSCVVVVVVLCGCFDVCEEEDGEMVERVSIYYTYQKKKCHRKTRAVGLDVDCYLK